ncbi:MAG TPA: hypothetical protein VNK26_06385, partial [Pyrinomonadaceae bacterium]|nr:hypothetical protein [Pyrinomonadaceae bacterium]
MNKEYSYSSYNRLGSGDLVDAAIRFYKDNFAALILSASPAVFAGIICQIAWIYFVENSLNLDSRENELANGLVRFIGRGLIFTVELWVAVTILGGSARSIVRNIIYKESLTFKRVISATRLNFTRLLAAAIFFILVVLPLATIIAYVGFAVSTVVFIFLMYLTIGDEPNNRFESLFLLFGFLIFFSLLLLTFWLVCALISRVALIPQAISIENKSFTNALMRSIYLGRGGSKKIAALFSFTTVAILAVMIFLYVPLGWYAWLEGYNIEMLLAFDPDAVPVWYNIAANVAYQLAILLALP